MNLISPIVNRWIQDAKDNPDAFWGRAADQLHWFRTWDKVFEWNYPSFRWFVGAQTNLAYNALDKHVKEGWGGHTALIYLNERGERRLERRDDVDARPRPPSSGWILRRGLSRLRCHRLLSAIAPGNISIRRAMPPLAPCEMEPDKKTSSILLPGCEWW